MALRTIHPIDGLAVALAMIRPDWSVTHVAAVLARSSGSHSEIAQRALTLALDPDVRTPNGIENADMRRYDRVPVLPSVSDLLAETDDRNLCGHGGVRGRCPFCRGAA